jgi:hypothetical protein
MVFSGAWGKLIHEKTRSKKSRDTIPLTCEYRREFSENFEMFFFRAWWKMIHEKT